jgi:capsule polysaccharide export protein KpsE/RkpR
MDHIVCEYAFGMKLRQYRALETDRTELKRYELHTELRQLKYANTELVEGMSVLQTELSESHLSNRDLQTELSESHSNIRELHTEVSQLKKQLEQQQQQL